MSWNENNSIVWDFIASSKTPVIADDIVMNLGFDNIEVKKILFNLIKIRLIKKNINNQYELNNIITTLDWVEAVDSGIDISSLEKYVKLDVEERNKGIEIASNGTLEKHLTEKINNKKKDFKNYLKGKAMTEAATTDLAERLNDSKKLLNDWLIKEKNQELSDIEKVIYRITKTTHDELDKTYNSLIAKLIKKNER